MMCPQIHRFIQAFSFVQQNLLYYYCYLTSPEHPNSIPKLELPKVRNYISFPYYILYYIILLLRPTHGKYTIMSSQLITITIEYMREINYR